MLIGKVNYYAEIIIPNKNYYELTNLIGLQNKVDQPADLQNMNQ